MHFATLAAFILNFLHLPLACLHISTVSIQLELYVDDSPKGVISQVCISVPEQYDGVLIFLCGSGKGTNHAVSILGYSPPQACSKHDKAALAWHHKLAKEFRKLLSGWVSAAGVPDEREKLYTTWYANTLKLFRSTVLNKIIKADGYIPYPKDGEFITWADMQQSVLKVTYLQCSTHH